MPQAARPTDPPLSVDDFRRMPEEEGWRVELARGRLVREPAPGPAHGRLEARLAMRLGSFVEASGKGVLLSDTGFVLSRGPDTVRVPDLSFVAEERVPEEGYGSGFWSIAPDLAVEVLSPSNRASELQEKIRDYLEAGCLEVWVLDPEARTAAIYEARGEVRILSESEILTSTTLFPGFEARIDDLFGS